MENTVGDLLGEGVGEQAREVDVGGVGRGEKTGNGTGLVHTE